MITELPQSLGGNKQNLVHTRSQEKEEVSLQETESDLPVSVQESLVEGTNNREEHSPVHQQKIGLKIY